MSEVKVEIAKSAPALIGAGASIITLSNLVALATLIYISVQIYILLEKRKWNIIDRKSKG